MKRKKPTQVNRDSDQGRRLRALARQRGETESQVIRGGVDRILSNPMASGFDPAAWEKEKAFIDALIRKGPIARKRTWRREDLDGR